MYRDSFTQSPLMRFLRLFEAKFRLGRAFGVDVYVYWVLLILMPLLFASRLGASGVGAFEQLICACLLVLCLYAIVWSHEMGHIAAGWRYGVHTPLITLSPLGGVAHMAAAAPNPRSDIVISLAGPAVHLAWLAVFWPLSHVVEWGWAQPTGWGYDPLWITVQFLFQANIWLLCFNLLPIFPLDGGRVLRSALAMRMHANRATFIAARVGKIGNVVLGIVGLIWFGPYAFILILIAITGFIACVQEERAARWQMSPYAGQDEAFAAWQTHPDAWKQSSGQPVRSARKPGPIARLRARLRQRAAKKAAERAVESDRELDRLLEKIKQNGIDKLTPRERAFLRRESKNRRDTG